VCVRAHTHTHTIELSRMWQFLFGRSWTAFNHLVTIHLVKQNFFSVATYFWANLNTSDQTSLPHGPNFKILCKANISVSKIHFQTTRDINVHSLLQCKLAQAVTLPTFTGRCPVRILARTLTLLTFFIAIFYKFFTCLITGFLSKINKCVINHSTDIFCPHNYCQL
jgi:hypothetical protein